MMRSVIRFGLPILFFVVSPLASLAQDYAPKGSVGGGMGHGRFLDDEGTLGTGLLYRGAAEWRPISRLGLEAEIQGTSFQRGDNFHVNGDAHFVFANAIFYFSRSRVQPYIKGGAGFYRTRYTYSWPVSSPEEYHQARSAAAVNLGGGLRFFLNRHWSVTPDFRLAVGSGYHALISYPSITAAYHW